MKFRKKTDSSFGLLEKLSFNPHLRLKILAKKFYWCLNIKSNSFGFVMIAERKVKNIFVKNLKIV